MQRTIVLAIGMVTLTTALAAPGQTSAWPTFRAQEIASDLTIGYAVLTADINNDKKPDIVVIDKHRVIWYENPSWKVRTILQGKTRADNVCAAPLDIDGDGQLELVLGANWNAGTKTPGTLQWLKRGATLDEEWTMHAIPCEEPTIHRVQAIDVSGDGKPEIVVVPLQGRDTSAKGNWTDGRPLRVLAYSVPQKPTQPDAWKPVVLSDSLFVAHNFCSFPDAKFSKTGTAVLVGSYEGVNLIYADEKANWKTVNLHPAHQENPRGSRGVSEIRRSRDGRGLIATIEPWHGTQVVIYTPDHPAEKDTKRTRQVLDTQLRWGHALAFADLDGDGREELVAGVRDDPNPKQGDQFMDRRGVRIYRSTDAQGKKWERLLVDPGSVAVEDLVSTDLNGDGRPDIIAVGRQTRNCRIYWNEGN